MDEPREAIKKLVKAAKKVIRPEPSKPSTESKPTT